MTKKHTAIGCHVFAGGFTMGVRRVMKVEEQLEIHDFGRETVEQQLGLKFTNADTWQEWPKREADFLYGNPRCTGFSSMTCGYDDTIHGPFAKCTQDIRDLVAYAKRQAFPVFAWESVQQAYTVGRPLLRVLVEDIRQEYRVAHCFLNAASFGNAQKRKRYFFVAYRRDLQFNAEPPKLPERQVTVRDVIEQFEDRPTREWPVGNRFADYDDDCYNRLCTEDKVVVPHLHQGECFNELGRRTEMVGISDKYAGAWRRRMSDLPFSLHCPNRLDYDRHCPTMSSSCLNYIHPRHDRPLTVLELSRLMGWDVTPRGRNPAGQIAKGICPEVGEWLAEQVGLCLSGAWGKHDWGSRYDTKTKRWLGEDYTGDVPPDEKVINMTEYVPCDEHSDQLSITA